MPADIRDEILHIGLLLPVCHSNMKTQLSSRVSATDATTTAGGSAYTYASTEFVSALYRSVEVKGCHTYLPGHMSAAAADEKFPHLAEDPVVSSFGEAGDWKALRSCVHPANHVNVLELTEICEEAKRLCLSCFSPVRQINLSDSAVSLGAWGKFRSSSYKLNKPLRRVSGWLVLSQKLLYNVHVRSKYNPGDPPSRFRKIIRQDPPDWLIPHL